MLLTNLNVLHDAETSFRRLNWYVSKTELFEAFLRRLTGTFVKQTNLRRRSDVPTGVYVRLTNLTRRRDVLTGT